MAKQRLERVTLNGSLVREACADLGLSLPQLAKVVGIPPGTIRNVTRAENPDRVRMYRARRIANAVGLPLAEVLASSEGVPDEPVGQPQGPKGPTRRQDSEGDHKKRTGPKRVTKQRVA